jgi:SEC-C motif-containing protein
MSHCPCGSSLAFDDCCGPILAGTPAATPEALIRSRYSAFVLGKLDHVERTHAPEIRGDFNRAEAERTITEVEWLGLEVRNAREDGDNGSVEFAIRFRRNEQDLSQYEVADFRRIDGQWFYAGGKTSASHPPRHVVKTGRNDPCHCGSGKKFKKCCGA